MGVAEVAMGLPETRVSPIQRTQIAVGSLPPREPGKIDAAEASCRWRRSRALTGTVGVLTGVREGLRRAGDRGRADVLEQVPLLFRSAGRESPAFRADGPRSSLELGSSG